MLLGVSDCLQVWLLRSCYKKKHEFSHANWTFSLFLPQLDALWIGCALKYGLLFVSSICMHLEMVINGLSEQCQVQLLDANAAALFQILLSFLPWKHHWQCSRELNALFWPFWQRCMYLQSRNALWLARYFIQQRFDRKKCSIQLKMNRFTQYLLFHTSSKVNMMSSFTHPHVVSKMFIISAILCKWKLMQTLFQKMTIKVVICVLFSKSSQVRC